VFALANMLHLLAHKFPRLSAGRFALARVFARALDCFAFGHGLYFLAVARVWLRPLPRPLDGAAG
jgi:hypothetical protein